MSKKGKSESKLGRALIKSRFQNNRGRKLVDNNSMLHTTEVQDGYDWNKINLRSVTEESSFQEFLSTAELAGKEFQGEKLNIKFISVTASACVPSAEERKKLSNEHERNKEMLKIPRRPLWNAQTTPEELDRAERDSFLEWRRTLATMQEEKGFLVTPFEKNLEFWRQLWRVVERSDVIVQIVDARNPLLFRCEDLEKYVTEVSDRKRNMILVNKADFLTTEQRIAWIDYFDKAGVKVAFFSAIAEEEKPVTSEGMTASDLQNAIDALAIKVEETAKKFALILNDPAASSSEVLTRSSLIDLFRNLRPADAKAGEPTVIGLVGYPNVGKSSTINALMCEKKVSVSATPGKTKHFQTLHLDADLILCDCPGLVMPSFVHTKADMILNGILPIDQMREHATSVELLTSLIPRNVFASKYGLLLGNEDEAFGAQRLLTSYAYNRGFMTANGQPDASRAARQILKDYVNGKLLYCRAPPNVQQETYHTYEVRELIQNSRHVPPPAEVRATQGHKVTTGEIDRKFFAGNKSGVHAKGVQPAVKGAAEGEKPWKQFNKHCNKKKKEKLRRVYRHLDEC